MANVNVDSNPQQQKSLDQFWEASSQSIVNETPIKEMRDSLHEERTLSQNVIEITGLQERIG